MTKINENLKPHLVLAVFAFVLYANTLNNFFAFDDKTVYTHNIFTQQGIKGIPDLFKYDTFSGYLLRVYNLTVDQLNDEMKILAGGRYRPLSLVTFALEVELFGQEKAYPNDIEQFTGNAFVSHLVNILMYLFTTCLLFSVLRRLFSSCKNTKWYLSFPFLAALLFLFHPIHSEVVANIKGRDEIMALLGSLGALWFTVNYFETNKKSHLLWSGLCLFLGLLSKEIAITFVAVIPLSIYYFVDKRPQKICISIIPLLLVSALFLCIRASVAGFIATDNIEPDILNNPFVYATTAETLATSFYTLLLYVKLLFFPHPLTYDYYPYHIEITNWANPLVIISLLFYLGIGIYAVYGLIKKRDVVSWSIWLFMMPLSVVSNLFFPIGAFMGERFVFFSSVGFAVLTGWAIYAYFSKAAKNKKLSMIFTCAVMVIILSLYASKTISRNRVWKDDFTLFSTDVQTSKNSAKGNCAAGFQYLLKAIYPNDKNEAGKKKEYCDKAAKLLNHAIQLYPLYTDVIEQLGNLYCGCYVDIAKSLHYYAIALQLEKRRNAEIAAAAKEILNMTPGLLEDNSVTSTAEEMIQSCDELLEVNPHIGEAYYIKGIIYGKYLNNIEMALDNLEQALSMDFPKTVKFYEFLGTAYGFAGDFPKAVQYLLQAIESGSYDYNIYLNLGVIYQQIGDRTNAEFYAAKGNEMKHSIENNH